MSAKRTGLGRGLDALLGDVDVDVAKVPPVLTEATSRRPVDNELRHISVDLLRRGTYQPRQEIGQEALEELAESIRAQGLVQPIVVRPVQERDPSGAQQYEIIAGERRWRAAQLAGLTRIPAVVRDMPDSAAIAVALIENIQREDLNPLEESAGLRRLIDEFDLTHLQAAEAVGRSRAAVSNLLRLQDLVVAAKKLVQSRDLEMGHARALLAIHDAAMQGEVAALIAKRGMSVRAAEVFIKRLLKSEDKPAKTTTDNSDPDIRRLQADLAEKLGARVEITHGGNGSGKLVVSYNSLDELEGILEHIQ